ncbi:MAG: hypothetical protein ACI396_01170, partial [Acutalibacteraceae bacterium]
MAVAIIIFAAFLLLGVLYFRKILEKLSEKGLRICAIMLFAVLALGMVISMIIFRSYPVTDSYITLNESLAIAQGAEKTLDQSIRYFAVYSNNNLFTLIHVPLFKLLAKLGVTDYLLPLTVINAVLVFLSHIFTYFAAKRLFGGKNAVFVLLLCVINPVYYIMIHWIYTATYSLLPMMMIVWLFSLLKGEHRKSRIILYSALIGVVGVFGYLLRPTAIFPIMAVAACVAIWFIGSTREQLKDKFKRCLCASLSFILVFGICFVGAKSAMKPFIKDTSRNLPLVHWIAMSMHGDGSWDPVFYEKMTKRKNAKEMKSTAIEDIKQTVKKDGVIGISARMFYKLINTWSDGSCGYYRRLTKSANNTQISFYDYICGDKRNFAMLYSQALRLMLFMLAIISMISQFKKRKSLLLPFTVTLLGSMLFYMLWEAKPEYSSPFLLILFIIAADGMDVLFGALSKMPHKSALKTQSAAIASCAVMMIATLSLLLQQYDSHVNQKIIFNAYSVNVTEENPRECVGIYRNDTEIEQQFYASRPFNRIEFAAKKHNNDDTEYLVSLCDENGNTLQSQTVTAEQINAKSRLPVYFDLEKPNGKQKYILRIGKAQNEAHRDSLAVRYKRTYGIGSIDGECTVNGETAPDILMNVTGRYKSSYYSAAIYMLLAAACIAFEVAILILLIK